MTATGGYVLAVIVAAVAFACWWSADSDLRDHTERLAVIEAALQLGGDNRAVVDEPLPATVEAPAVDVIGGVRAAREANRPRPTPLPREGRHRAG